MGVGGQGHPPAALPPRKTRYPMQRMLGGSQGRCGRVRKISPPTGIRSPDRPARSIPTLNSLYRVSFTFLLMVLSQAATFSLHEAELLHPVVLGEQINEQDGRLNPTVILNFCLYCAWSAISYMLRLSCCHLQGVFLYRDVNVITCVCPCGLRSQSAHARFVISVL